jgi:hypothetical protein
VGQFGKNDAENPAETAGLYANWPTTDDGTALLALRARVTDHQMLWRLAFAALHFAPPNIFFLFSWGVLRT